jgi:hypothetical protein
MQVKLLSFSLFKYIRAGTFASDKIEQISDS